MVCTSWAYLFSVNIFTAIEEGAVYGAWPPHVTTISYHDPSWLTHAMTISQSRLSSSLHFHPFNFGRRSAVLLQHYDDSALNWLVRLKA